MAYMGAILSFHGTNTDQDPCYKNKEKSMLKEMEKRKEFPHNFCIPVDMAKIDMVETKSFVEAKIAELMGEDDDVAAGYCMAQLEAEQKKKDASKMDPRKLQLYLKSMLQNQAAPFCSFLWDFLLGMQERGDIVKTEEEKRYEMKLKFKEESTSYTWAGGYSSKYPPPPPPGGPSRFEPPPPIEYHGIKNRSDFDPRDELRMVDPPRSQRWGGNNEKSSRHDGSSRRFRDEDGRDPDRHSKYGSSSQRSTRSSRGSSEWVWGGGSERSPSRGRKRRKGSSSSPDRSRSPTRFTTNPKADVRRGSPTRFSDGPPMAAAPQAPPPPEAKDIAKVTTQSIFSL